MAGKTGTTDHKKTAEESADSQKLDSLLSTLDGDLTKVDTEAALNALDEWYGIVNKAHEPEAKELSQTLKELKQLLKGGKATGHEIGEVLIEIGEHTSHIASEAEKDLKTPLQKLGKQLKAVGTSLGKAEDKEQIEDIDSLVETLEGDLTSIDTDKAVSAIDHWYTLLHKSENENYKEIANELKQLKQSVKSSKAKGADIGEILVKLGEQTQEAAKEAPRGIKGPVQRLGKLLCKTGKSLEN
ncbi:MAG: hypothetical protein PUP93_06870 [Rhizonema sp. NSF051]|nr:hypothetical protein [Rhizonema sp. NSF051]